MRENEARVTMKETKLRNFNKTMAIAEKEIREKKRLRQVQFQRNGYLIARLVSTHSIVSPSSCFNAIYHDKTLDNTVVKLVSGFRPSLDARVPR